MLFVSIRWALLCQEHIEIYLQKERYSIYASLLVWREYSVSYSYRRETLGFTWYYKINDGDKDAWKENKNMLHK